MSVVVPVHDMLPYLGRCVDSLRSQTLERIEIVLVDDGSTDGSSRLCDELAARDRRIRVVHQANGGLSRARNAGIDAARGGFVSFVDSDDYLAPEALELLHAASVRNGNAIAGMGCVLLDSRLRELGRSCPDTRRTRLVPAPEYLDGMCRKKLSESVCDKLFPAGIIREIRFEPGRLNEDFLCLGRILLRGHPVAVLDYPGYHYVKREGSITSTGGNRVSLRDAVRNSQELFRLAAGGDPAAHRAFAHSLLFQARVFLTLVPLRDVLSGTGGWREVLELAKDAWDERGRAGLKARDRWFLAGMRRLPRATRLAAGLLRSVLGASR